MLKKIKKPLLFLSEFTGESYCCPLCGREIFRSDESGLCERCLSKLLFTEKESECRRCGRPTDGKRAFCGECDDDMYCVKVRSVCVYDDFSKLIVLGLKADKHAYFAEIAGDFLYKKFLGAEMTADVVTAVPTFRKSKKYFNHSELMAKRFCMNSGIPFSDGLIKIVNNSGQETKTREQRQNNVKGVFDVNSDDFAGRTVILVDDVRTSGATLNESAKALLEKGNAKEVFGLTFATTKLLRETN